VITVSLAASPQIFANTSGLLQGCPETIGKYQIENFALTQNYVILNLVEEPNYRLRPLQCSGMCLASQSLKNQGLLRRGE
jgi:hypothetical protein